MSISLEVTFGGLCLFVVDALGKQVGVVMPDARSQKLDSQGEISDASDPHHEDNTVGVPHVGYVRMNLANLSGFDGLPSGTTATGPAYEVVHRFTEQQLTFEFTPESTIPIQFDGKALPSFDTFATYVKARADLFGASPPQILFRTRLVGGAVSAAGPARDRLMPPGLRGCKDKLGGGTFNGHVKWKQQVTGPVTLRFSSLSASGKTTETIKLQPRDGPNGPIIDLSIANLCDNPLEWIELPKPTTEEDDIDFKWLYRLVESTTTDSIPARLFGGEFPIPRVDPQGPQGDQSCTAGHIGGSFTFTPAM